MSTALRDRAEHAARYSTNLVVAAIEIKQLLDQRDQAVDTARTAQQRADDTETRIQAARELHQRTVCPEADYCEHCPCACGEAWPCATIRAIDETPALAEGGDAR